MTCPSSDLRIFMRKRMVTGNDYTHTGMYLPLVGKYKIEDCDMDEFYKKYEECKQKSYEMGLKFNIGLTERQSEYAPVLIDVDLRPKDFKRIYTKRDMIQLTKLYKTAISEYIEIDNADLTVIVLEKPEPRISNDVIKDGFHMQFMGVIVDKETHKKIHEYVIDKLSEDNFISHLGEIKQIIDISVTRNNWMVYGACKKDDIRGYEVTGVINTDNDFVENKEPYEAKVLSIRGRKMVLKKKVLSIVNNCGNNNNKNMNTFNVTETVKTDLHQRIQDLLNLLKKERCDDERSWIEVGWCLHNIDKSLLYLWVEWSKQSDKFKDGECEQRWKKFNNDGFTISSLYMWAKQDNPDGYTEFRRKDSELLLVAALSKTHYDVAAYLYHKYRHLFTCCSIRKTSWFHFESHRWIEIEDGHLLLDKMSTDMAGDVNKLNTWYIKKIMNDANLSEKEKELYKEKSKDCIKLLILLKDNSYKHKVMKECCSLFYDRKFLDKLDSKTHLYGFENGVYDVESLCFREGRPDDFISLSSKTHFFGDKTSESLNNFINSVLPQPEMKMYVLKLLASCMEGSTRDQKFHIWTGSGANGKSSLIDLFEMCMGEYSCKLPITLLTKKRNASNAASPEVLASKGKRFATMQEPDFGDQINVGYMKELTGGDSIYARGLYANPVEFKPQFKLVLTCNKLPEIPATDQGTWRRLRVVPFPVKFVDDPDPRNPYELKKDYSIREKMTTWVEPFICILIDALKEYKTNGLHEPDEVLKYTKLFQNRSDTMMTYYTENIEKTDNATDIIKFRVFYDHFKAWYRDTNSGLSIPTSKEFKEDLESRDLYSKNNKGFYQGIRFIREMEETEEE